MANAIYDPEEEALLRRAHEYATGQVPYDNEEDLLNQAQSYAQNPRYWNQAGPAPQAYDPTLEPADAYPGNVPQSEFMAPQQAGSYDGMGDVGQYANDEPIGGTGLEQAYSPNRPGFFYAGPVAGEAQARQQWNDRPGVDAPLDYSGNAAAQKYALQFERVKSQYDAQREIENAYAQAKNQQEMAAARSAEEFARQQNTQRAIEGGMTPYEALATYGVGGRGGHMTAAAINALKPATITSQTLPGGATVVSNGKTFRIIDAPPVDIQTKDGTIKGQLINDPNTGQPDPHRYAVINNRTGKYDIINTQEKASPEVMAKVPLAGPNPNIPGPVLSGPASRMEDYGVTNFAKSNPASRKAVGGYKLGATYKGGLKYLGGDPKDPNSWDHGK